MNIDEAINQPRIAYMAGTITKSAEFDVGMVEQLKAAGYTEWGDYNAIGFPVAIMYMEDGTMQGSAEDHSSISFYSDGVALGF